MGRERFETFEPAASRSVDYGAGYAFGYDRLSRSHDIVHTAAGIQVRPVSPGFAATRAVSGLRHEVLSGGVLTDEDAAVRQHYEEASDRVRKKGAAMAQDAAIVALCGKSLVAFLRDLLAKPPG